MDFETYRDLVVAGRTVRVVLGIVGKARCSSCAELGPVLGLLSGLPELSSVVSLFLLALDAMLLLGVTIFREVTLLGAFCTRATRRLSGGHPSFDEGHTVGTLYTLWEPVLISQSRDQVEDLDVLELRSQCASESSGHLTLVKLINDYSSL